MGEPRGFLTYERAEPAKQTPDERIKHSSEFTNAFPQSVLREQGARCMDCGVPFCHRGCPLGNNIPEWNHMVSTGDDQNALNALLATNNFPEFTGRVCPAPCESACVLGINEDPVAIESIEMSLADKGFAEGWIQPVKPLQRSGRSVAIVGSGPAGLAAAQQLNRAGHHVTVFERASHAGGLLMFGIPDFKLEKSKVIRRIELLKDEGIEFRCGVNVGSDVTLEQLRKTFDAVLMACGATQARDLMIPNRNAQGVYSAQEFLTASTRNLLDSNERIPQLLHAADKNVIVIGGGDTGADCVGTARRQGARSIHQFELLPMPPVLPKFPRLNQRPSHTPWPESPYMLRTSTSHEEGCQREFTLESVSFECDSQGRLTALVTRSVRQVKDVKGHTKLEAVEHSEKRWDCDLALVAIGFSGPETKGLIENSGLKLTGQGLVSAQSGNYMTNLEGVFAAGDARRGQSLVVWAIAEGRQAANSIDRYLQTKIKDDAAAADSATDPAFSCTAAFGSSAGQF
jgi:glutamate synthase (NADPH/NADH) small chain